MKDVTVIGKRSGIELKIGLEIFIKLIVWYVQDSPREARDINTVIEITRLHDRLQNLFESEFAAVEKRIDDMVLESAEREALNEEGGNVLVGEDLKRFIESAIKRNAAGKKGP